MKILILTNEELQLLDRALSCLQSETASDHEDNEAEKLRTKLNSRPAYLRSERTFSRW